MDNLYKIQLLKTIYDGMEVICDNYFIYKKDDINYLYDLDCNLIESGAKKVFYKEGDFLIKQENDIIKVISLKYNKTLEIKDDTNLHCRVEISSPVSYLLFIKTYESGAICDLKLNKITDTPNIEIISKHCHSEGHLTYLRYRKQYSNYYSDLIINHRESKVVSYGEIKINDDYSLFATEYNKSYSINYLRASISSHKDKIDGCKYKLGFRKTIIGEKSFDDIVTFYPNCTEYFVTYKHITSLEPGLNNSDLYKTLFGVIDCNGKIILNNYYNRIEYLGSGRFYLEFKGMKAIYNSLTGKYDFDFGLVKSFSQHSTFPLSFVQLTDNSYYVIEYFGKIYNYNNINENLNIHISNENPNILKVEYNRNCGDIPITKYTDLKLNVITNNQAIHNCIGYTWTKI